DFQSHVGRERLRVPRPRSDCSDLLAIVDDLIGDVARQTSWLSYLLKQLGLSEEIAITVHRRWRGRSTGDVRSFAPYARFCLRAHLAVSILWAHKMTKLESNNYVDVQYLYYLPFCQYF